MRRIWVLVSLSILLLFSATAAATPREQKTVEVFLGNTSATIAAGASATYSFSVQLPEPNPSIVNASIEIDGGQTAATISTLTFSLNGSTAATLTTPAIAHVWKNRFNATSAAANLYSINNNNRFDYTMTVAVGAGGAIQSAVSAKLWLTYSHDPVVTQRSVKTVRILAMNSSTTLAAAGSLTQYFSVQLPEPGARVENASFEISSGNDAIANGVLTAALNGTVLAAFTENVARREPLWTHRVNASSSAANIYFTDNARHDYYLTLTATTNAHKSLSAMLVLTYSYDPVTTERQQKEVEVFLGNTSATIAAGGSVTYSFSVQLPEPNPSIVNASIEIDGGQTAATITTLTFSLNGSTAATLTTPAIRHVWKMRFNATSAAADLYSINNNNRFDYTMTVAVGAAQAIQSAVSAKLWLTYSHDPVVTQRSLKTVRILALNSSTTLAAAGSLTQYFSVQLPEPGARVENASFEISSGNDAAANGALTAALNGTVLAAFTENVLRREPLWTHRVNASSSAANIYFTDNARHDYYLTLTATTNAHKSLSAMLVLTYSHDPLDVRPPQFQEYGTNRTAVHKNETILLFSNWTDDHGLNASSLETNATPGGAVQNVTYNTSLATTQALLLGMAQNFANFTQNSTNFTNVTPGIKHWRIFTNDTYGIPPNLNNTTNSTFELWGWSNITMNTSSGTYEWGDNITLMCNVTDKNNNTGVSRYYVSFYNVTPSGGETYLGSNLTNGTGIATLNWTASSAPLGTYYPKCNITDNATLFYNASEYNETNISVILQDTQPTQWVSSGQTRSIVHRNETVLLYSNWTDNYNLSGAWLSTNETGIWVNSTVRGLGRLIDDLGTVRWNVTANTASASATLGETTQGYLRDAMEISYSYGDAFSNDEFEINFSFAPINANSFEKFVYYVRADAANQHKTRLNFYSGGTSCGYTSTQTIDTADWKQVQFLVSDVGGLCDKTSVDQIRIRFDDVDDTVTGSGSILLDEVYLTSDTLTQSFANFTWKNFSTPVGTIVGWKVYANDTSNNYNNTTNLTFQFWGWANITNLTPVNDSVPQGSIVTLTCRVRDKNNGSVIRGYNVSFYNNTALTGFIGSNLTDASGNATVNWNTAGWAAGTHYPSFVLESENTTLFYNASEFNRTNTTITLIEVGVEPPKWVTPSANRTLVHKNESIEFRVNWTDDTGIDNTTLAWNATLGGAWANVSFNESISGTQSWSNFTRGTYADFLNGGLGIKGWRQYANDTNGNLNSSSVLTFELWGWTNITNETPAQTVVQGSNVTLMCWVRDKDNASSINGYNVSFYREASLTNLIGSNLTNGTGRASVGWNTTGVSPGTYYPTCVLESSNATLFYNASEQNMANTTITIPTPPGISSSLPAGDTVTDSPLNASREFRVTADQDVTVTWYINGTQVFQESVGAYVASTYTNTSLSSGTWNVTARASNANGAVQRIWTWTVYSTPSIVGSSPATDPSTSPGQSRQFQVTADQAVLVRWYINGTQVFQENVGALTASIYTNSSGQSGYWNVTATANNSNGTVSRQWNWTVYSTPNITSFAPATNTPDSPGATRKFNITVDQAVNATWYINGYVVQTNCTTPATEHSYTNLSAQTGYWNVTVSVNNSNGTTPKQWNWTVYNPPQITSFAPPTDPSDSPGATRTFNVTTDQITDITWYINGSSIYTNTSVTSAWHNNSSAVSGIWNITAFATNANGTAYKTWNWTVYAGLQIVSFEPLTDPSDSPSATRAFNVTANQAANATWYIDSSAVQTNLTPSTEISYTNTSAISGTWNVTVIVNNSNGTSSKQWNWSVFAAPNITSYAPEMPVSDTVGASRSFNITADQTVNVSWQINSVEAQLNTSVSSGTVVWYNNSSAQPGNWNVSAIVSNVNGTDMQTWTWNVGAAPALKLYREQSNGTGTNGIMKVTLIVYNTNATQTNASDINLTEWFNDTWAVIDCGECAANNSTTITWNSTSTSSLGELQPDNFVMLQYTIQAPSSSGYSPFTANATYIYGVQDGTATGEFDPWNVTVQQYRAMFEFELDLWRADVAINRTIANNTDYYAAWTVSNIGDSRIPDGENLTIRLEYNKSAWNISNMDCPQCIADSCGVISLNATHNAAECLISNSTTEPGMTVQVNFTIRASSGVLHYDEIVTSNATYDPPLIPTPAKPSSGNMKELKRPLGSAPTPISAEPLKTEADTELVNENVYETNGSAASHAFDWIQFILRLIGRGVV
jgi:hypothetical protein